MGKQCEAGPLTNCLSNSSLTLLEKEKNQRKENWRIAMPKLEAYGMLARNKDKQWVLLSESEGDPRKNGTLHVPVLKGKSQQSFPVVGSVEDGKHTLDKSQDRYFHIGRPVFLQVDNNR